MPEESKKPEEKKQEETFLNDPILSVLADDIPAIVEAEKKKDAPPVAPEVKAAPEGGDKKEGAEEKKPEGSKEGEKKEEEKPKVGVKKREDPRAIAEEVVDKRLAQVLPLPPAKEEKKEETEAEVQIDEDQLTEDQREELEDARFMERSDPKNKGRAKQLVEYYKKVEDWVASKKDDPDRTFDDKDEEFMAIVRSNRPAWAGKDQAKIRRARLKEELKAELRQESAKENEQVAVDAREARYAPEVKKVVENFTESFNTKAKTDDPLEREVYDEYGRSAAELAETHMRLHYGLEKRSTNNQAHVWLTNFIDGQAQLFVERGGDARVRGGKSFLPPAEYAKAKDKDSHWTFSNGDVLNMIQAHAVLGAKEAIKAEEEKAQRRGFVKAKKPAQTKSEEDVKPISGVKATATPAPGVSQDAGSVDDNHPGKELLQILELK